jgi:hypothetical protein
MRVKLIHAEAISVSKENSWKELTECASLPLHHSHAFNSTQLDSWKVKRRLMIVTKRPDMIYIDRHLYPRSIRVHQREGNKFTRFRVVREPTLIETIILEDAKGKSPKQRAFVLIR